MSDKKSRKSRIGSSRRLMRNQNEMKSEKDDGSQMWLDNRTGVEVRADSDTVILETDPNSSDNSSPITQYMEEESHSTFDLSESQPSQSGNPHLLDSDTTGKKRKLGSRRNKDRQGGREVRAKQVHKTAEEIGEDTASSEALFSNSSELLQDTAGTISIPRQSQDFVGQDVLYSVEQEENKPTHLADIGDETTIGSGSIDTNTPSDKKTHKYTSVSDSSVSKSTDLERLPEQSEFTSPLSQSPSSQSFQFHHDSALTGSNTTGRRKKMGSTRRNLTDRQGEQKGEVVDKDIQEEQAELSTEGIIQEESKLEMLTPLKEGEKEEERRASEHDTTASSTFDTSMYTSIISDQSFKFETSTMTEEDFESCNNTLIPESGEEAIDDERTELDRESGVFLNKSTRIIFEKIDEFHDAFHFQSEEARDHATHDTSQLIENRQLCLDTSNSLLFSEHCSQPSVSELPESRGITEEEGNQGTYGKTYDEEKPDHSMAEESPGDGAFDNMYNVIGSGSEKVEEIVEQKFEYSINTNMSPGGAASTMDIQGPEYSVWSEPTGLQSDDHDQLNSTHEETQTESKQTENIELFQHTGDECTHPSEDILSHRVTKQDFYDPTGNREMQPTDVDTHGTQSDAKVEFDYPSHDLKGYEDFEARELFQLEGKLHLEMGDDGHTLNEQNYLPTDVTEDSPTGQDNQEALNQIDDKENIRIKQEPNEASNNETQEAREEETAWEQVYGDEEKGSDKEEILKDLVSQEVEKLPGQREGIHLSLPTPPLDMSLCHTESAHIESNTAGKRRKMGSTRRNPRGRQEEKSREESQKEEHGDTEQSEDVIMGKEEVVGEEEKLEKKMELKDCADSLTEGDRDFQVREPYQSESKLPSEEDDDHPVNEQNVLYPDEKENINPTGPGNQEKLDKGPDDEPNMMPCALEDMSGVQSNETHEAEDEEERKLEKVYGNEEKGNKEEYTIENKTNDKEIEGSMNSHSVFEKFEDPAEEEHTALPVTENRDVLSELSDAHKCSLEEDIPCHLTQTGVLSFTDLPAVHTSEESRSSDSHVSNTLFSQPEEVKKLPEQSEDSTSFLQSPPSDSSLCHTESAHIESNTAGKRRKMGSTRRNPRGRQEEKSREESQKEEHGDTEQSEDVIMGKEEVVGEEEKLEKKMELKDCADSLTEGDRDFQVREPYQSESKLPSEEDDDHPVNEQNVLYPDEKENINPTGPGNQEKLDKGPDDEPNMMPCALEDMSGVQSNETHEAEDEEERKLEKVYGNEEKGNKEEYTIENRTNDKEIEGSMNSHSVFEKFEDPAEVEHTALPVKENRDVLSELSDAHKCSLEEDIPCHLTQTGVLSFTDLPAVHTSEESRSSDSHVSNTLFSQPEEVKKLPEQSEDSTSDSSLCHTESAHIESNTIGKRRKMGSTRMNPRGRHGEKMTEEKLEEMENVKVVITERHVLGTVERSAIEKTELQMLLKPEHGANDEEKREEERKDRDVPIEPISFDSSLYSFNISDQFHGQERSISGTELGDIETESYSDSNMALSAEPMELATGGLGQSGDTLLSEEFGDHVLHVNQSEISGSSQLMYEPAPESCQSDETLSTDPSFSQSHPYQIPDLESSNPSLSPLSIPSSQGNGDNLSTYSNTTGRRRKMGSTRRNPRSTGREEKRTEEGHVQEEEGKEMVKYIAEVLEAVEGFHIENTECEMLESMDRASNESHGREEREDENATNDSIICSFSTSNQSLQDRCVIDGALDGRRSESQMTNLESNPTGRRRKMESTHRNPRGRQGEDRTEVRQEENTEDSEMIVRDEEEAMIAVSKLGIDKTEFVEPTELFTENEREMASHKSGDVACIDIHMSADQLAHTAVEEHQFEPSDSSESFHSQCSQLHADNMAQNTESKATGKRRKMGSNRRTVKELHREIERPETKVDKSKIVENVVSDQGGKTEECAPLENFSIPNMELFMDQPNLILGQDEGFTSKESVENQQGRRKKMSSRRDGQGCVGKRETDPSEVRDEADFLSRTTQEHEAGLIGLEKQMEERSTKKERTHIEVVTLEGDNRPTSHDASVLGKDFAADPAGQRPSEPVAPTPDPGTGGQRRPAEQVEKSLVTRDRRQQLGSRSPVRGPNMYNVMMVGNSNVGKTSFIKRYQSGEFCLDHCATIGIDTFVQCVTVDGRPVTLQLWDTAGQERYHSITRQVFHKAQAFLLMYDITSSQSFCDVRYWVTCIQEGTTDDVVVVLLGNKSDCTNRQVQFHEGENLAKEYNIHFMECSAVTGDNVSQSMEMLARMLKQKVEEIEEGSLMLQKEPPQKKSSGCC